jgi:hypothetical protein
MQCLIGWIQAFEAASLYPTLVNGCPIIPACARVLHSEFWGRNKSQMNRALQEQIESTQQCKDRIQMPRVCSSRVHSGFGPLLGPTSAPVLIPTMHLTGGIAHGLGPLLDPEPAPDGHGSLLGPTSAPYGLGPQPCCWTNPLVMYMMYT